MTLEIQIDPGFGQAQKCGRDKPVNGMSTMLS
jgi:hypothetical protein